MSLKIHEFASSQTLSRPIWTYCWANNVGNCCVRVGGGVQTNSQQCWPITRVGLSREVIVLLSIRRSCVMIVPGPRNVGKAVQTDPSYIVALRFGDHGTKEMYRVLGSKVCPVSNFA